MQHVIWLCVQDEMRQGLSYFHETIFASLPVFQRRIDTALSNIGMPKVPLEHNLFRFGSWMGGDRDGNPFVTPETTREVVITARLSAVNLYSQQIEQLMFDLSIWRCNGEVQVIRHSACRNLPQPLALPNPSPAVCHRHAFIAIQGA